jgi:uncharacterized lipoprotein YddW (UPF0748 family)
MGLNTVILQVRPQADAFYVSELEPWSEYITGREGTAPNPLWDPLEFAVFEAHIRGLELHAWVNPFRAKAETAKSPMAPNHFARHRPQMVRPYGKHLWLDPGEPEVREHCARVIMDIVNRYDIDGLHMDDYFYPYPEKDGRGVTLAFPDDTSWQAHGRTAGFSDKSDWRRANVDRFVEDIHTLVREAKPWVKFGISPFGIWRPDNPPGVRGLDAFELLSADSRKWLDRGWVDYLSPQLYWNIDAPQQSFPALLTWWVGQNSEFRHIWPGISVARIGQDRQAMEIARQIDLVRRQPGSTGYILYSANSLQRNRGGVADVLRGTVLTEPALVPPSPWMLTNAPVLADFTAIPIPNQPELRLTWSAANTNEVARFAFQSRYGRQWKLEIVPAHINQRIFAQRLGHRVPDEIRLIPIGRTGLEGNSGLWRRR